jgi:mono/diheme cytochrome c family protein
MKRAFVRGSLAGLAAIGLGACQTNLSNTAPPITPALVKAGERQHADARLLAEGRALLLSRCIQCHKLPNVAQYDAARLKAVVAVMSPRAGLTPGQHDAVLKYLLTARSQTDQLR